jgi:IclR family transcriptional regulator, acetate operon repressor
MSTPPMNGTLPGGPFAPSAIGKVVCVLEALADHRRISRIARATGLPASTVHRIVQELVELGWAREGGEHDYLLGPALARLAGQAEDYAELARPVRPVLRELVDRTGFTVHFGLRHGDEAVYVDRVDGRGAPRLGSRLHGAIPLHSTAIGKAILAALPESDVCVIAGRTRLRPRTGRTVTSLPDLLAELALVRAQGWALDDEENVPRIRCVGAAVLDQRGGPVGAVSVTGLADDLERRAMGRLAPFVVRTAREVSAALCAAGQVVRRRSARR